MTHEVRNTGAPHSCWRKVSTSYSFEASQDFCVGRPVLYTDNVQHQGAEAAKLDT